MAKKELGYTYAVGRRKTAVARVRFYEDTEKNGELLVNGKPVAEYFPVAETVMAQAPIELLAQDLGGRFSVKVLGGGTKSQAQAVAHGIARILIQMNPDWKAQLRAAGYITRDPRMKERKKPGLRRARRAPQWSKR